MHETLDSRVVHRGQKAAGAERRVVDEPVDRPELFAQPYDQIVNAGDLRQIERSEVKRALSFALNLAHRGVYFLAPRELAPGTAIELEVALVERPLGCGTVQMCTAAHIIRSDECDTPGWRGYAASFDDFALKRDDVIPLRYRTA